jgi:endonuclease G, mitochondrial
LKIQGNVLGRLAHFKHREIMKPLSNRKHFLKGLCIGVVLSAAVSICSFQGNVKQIKSQQWLYPSNIDKAASIMKYGSPQYNKLRIQGDTVVSFDTKTKVPSWVYEKISLRDLYGDANREKSQFKEDSSFPNEHVSHLKDFFRSGYDRGHLAPAGNHKSNQKAQNETFILSNIAPQIGKGFNRGIWNDIEKKTRRLLRGSKGNAKELHIVTGTLFLPNQKTKEVRYPVIGEGNVAVPTHFFKVVLVIKNEGEPEVFSFLVPHKKYQPNEPLEQFFVSVEKVESLSGLIFFKGLEGKINKKQTRKFL